MQLLLKNSTTWRDTPPTEDSRRRAIIKEWIIAFGANYATQKSVAIDEQSGQVYEKLWTAELADIPVDALEAVFRNAMRANKFWPTIADIRAQYDVAAEMSGAEEWESMLEYCRLWVHPDMKFEHAPALSPELDHAARAAGGVLAIRECPRDRLHFLKTAFLEDLARIRKSGDLVALLPSSKLRKQLTDVARLPWLSPAPPKAMLPAVKLDPLNAEQVEQFADVVEAEIEKRKTQRLSPVKNDIDLAEEARRQIQALKDRGLLDRNWQPGAKPNAGVAA
jgi:hypothetical protein